MKKRKPIAITNAGIKVKNCNFLKTVFEFIINPF